jgi:hypothetical protein
MNALEVTQRSLDAWNSYDADAILAYIPPEGQSIFFAVCAIN